MKNLIATFPGCTRHTPKSTLIRSAEIGQENYCFHNVVAEHSQFQNCLIKNRDGRIPNRISFLIPTVIALASSLVVQEASATLPFEVDYSGRQTAQNLTYEVHELTPSQIVNIENGEGFEKKKTNSTHVNTGWDNYYEFHPIASSFEIDKDTLIFSDKTGRYKKGDDFFVLADNDLTIQLNSSILRLFEDSNPNIAWSKGYFAQILKAKSNSTLKITGDEDSAFQFRGQALKSIYADGGNIDIKTGAFWGEIINEDDSASSLVESTSSGSISIDVAKDAVFKANTERAGSIDALIQNYGDLTIAGGQLYFEIEGDSSFSGSSDNIILNLQAERHNVSLGDRDTRLISLVGGRVGINASCLKSFSLKAENFQIIGDGHSESVGIKWIGYLDDYANFNTQTTYLENNAVGVLLDSGSKVEYATDYLIDRSADVSILLFGSNSGTILDLTVNDYAQLDKGIYSSELTNLKLKGGIFNIDGDITFARDDDPDWLYCRGALSVQSKGFFANKTINMIGSDLRSVANNELFVANRINAVTESTIDIHSQTVVIEGRDVTSALNLSSSTALFEVEKFGIIGSSSIGQQNLTSVKLSDSSLTINVDEVGQIDHMINSQNSDLTFGGLGYFVVNNDVYFNGNKTLKIESGRFAASQGIKLTGGAILSAPNDQGHLSLAFAQVDASHINTNVAALSLGFANSTTGNNDSKDVVVLTNGSSADVFAEKANIKGNVKVEDSNFSMVTRSSSSFEGQTICTGASSVLNIALGPESQWTVTNSSNLTTLTATDIEVALDLIGDRESPSIKMDSLVGSRNTFVLAHDDALTSVSFIELGKTDIDSIQTIQLSNSLSMENIGDIDVQFAVDASGQTTFVAGSSLADAGLFVVAPDLESKVNSAGGKDWFITNIENTPAPTPVSIIDGIENNYFFWRSLTDSTRERFGQLRHGESVGVWGRATAGSLSYGSIQNTYQTYRLGADASVNADWKVGIMAERHEGKLEASTGRGDMNATTASIYALYVGDSGFYADGGLRFGIMDYEYTNRSLLPDSYDYKSSAFGGWLEVGHEWEVAGGWTVSPHAAFSYGRFSAEDFTTANGLKASVDSVDSGIFTFGADFGFKLDGLELFFTADAKHEALGDQKISVSHEGSSIRQSVDYSDTWAEYGINLSYRPSDQSLVWLNVRRSSFADVEQDWKINLGARWLLD